MNDGIRSMEFFKLLDFLDSLPNKIIIPTRLRHILLSTHKAFPFSSIGEYLDAGDRASELLMRIPNFGIKTEFDLRRVIQEAMSAVVIDVNISEYDQVPLAELGLPGYEKLIKRIMKLNGFAMPSGEIFSIRNIGEIAKLDPNQFAKLPAVGRIYVRDLIALKKELPSFLNITKPKTPVIEPSPQITLSPTQLAGC